MQIRNKRQTLSIEMSAIAGNQNVKYGLPISIFTLQCVCVCVHTMYQINWISNQSSKLLEICSRQSEKCRIHGIVTTNSFSFPSLILKISIIQKYNGIFLSLLTVSKRHTCVYVYAYTAMCVCVWVYFARVYRFVSFGLILSEIE